MAGERGQESEQRARFDQARARHVRDHDAACADRLHQAWHAKVRCAVQFEGIDEVGVDAPPEHVRALQPCDCPDVDLVVARDEIIPLDEHEAQIAREVGLFEIGLAVGAGRHQADTRIGARCGGGERATECGEERGEALDVHRVVEPREGPR